MRIMQVGMQQTACDVGICFVLPLNSKLPREMPDSLPVGYCRLVSIEFRVRMFEEPLQDLKELSIFQTMKINTQPFCRVVFLLHPTETCD